MPLPKSCSIAARATEAYAEAWSVVLYECWGVKPPRDEPQPPLVQLLPFIRQLLTCCACAGLLEDAMVSISCGHCYCAKCQLGTPLLKIQCRQCKERTGLVSENQIQLVAKCYRHMCHVLAEYLASAPSPAPTVGDFTLAKGREIPEGFNPVTEILAEVVEGVKVSRNVLLVLPPQKYLNPKPPPDPPIPRKEHSPVVSYPNDPPAQVDNAPSHSTEDVDIVTMDDAEEAAPSNYDNSTTLVKIPLAGSVMPSSLRSHHKKKSRRDRKKGLGGEVKKSKNKSIHIPSSLKKVKRGKDIASAWFHGDIDFVSARPAARRGEMRLFASLKLLKLKQATRCGPETDTDVQVHDECLDKQFVTSENSVYRVRQDLPSVALLPHSLRPHMHISSTTSVNPSLLKSSSTSDKTQVKKAKMLHPCTGFVPRAKFKLLRPKFKSPYLSTSQDTPQKKPKAVVPEVTEEKKMPKITLSLCDPGMQETLPVKKKKRSPMTPGPWRCRCGTNNPQTFDRICARGKCPCFVKNIPCLNCLCRHCKNPYNFSSDLL